MIHAEGLVKEFRVPVRATGAFAGWRSFFSTRRDVKRAVDDISLEIDDGEFVAYLGRNGAGKSTTIKMLSGILMPTSGRVEVQGVVPWLDRRTNARNIGAVFGQRSQLWLDLPLRDSFELIGKLYGMSSSDYVRELTRFVDILSMGSFLDTPVRSLSLGQRMRGDIVAALLYRPPVLYLDEPTVGLDVIGKGVIREFITEQNREEGTTILLTTHDLEDIERLANRVIIIDSGRILYDGGLGALKARYAPYREVIVTTPAVPDSLAIEGIVLQDVVDVADGARATFRFDPSRVSTPTAISRLASSLPIHDLTSREPSIEDVVRQIYVDPDTSL